MFKKLFGKKNDGFFMQMDESNPAPAKAEPLAKAEKAEKTKVEKSEQKEPASPAHAAVEDVTPTAALAAEPTKAKKTSIKEKKKADKKETKAADKAATPLAAVPVSPVLPLPATTFATDYLIKPSSNGSRRRPGANMKSFVNMAREVKK
jgi:hypothetical protein